MLKNFWKRGFISATKPTSGIQNEKICLWERNGVYVIDITQTINLAKRASDFLFQISSEGKSVLFVATKRQAADIVRDAAVDCGAFYVTHRWL